MPRTRVLLGLAAALCFAAPVAAAAAIAVTALPTYSRAGGLTPGVNLTWTDPGNNVDYDIWRVASGSGSSCTVTPTILNQFATVNSATTFNDTPPSEGAWCYVVADAATDLIISNAVVTTYDSTPPATPTLTSPLAGAALRGTVSFTASSVSDALSGVGKTEVDVSLNGLIVPVWAAEATKLVPPFSTIAVDTSDPFYDATVWDVQWLTTDVAGNTAASAVAVGVTYDNTPPDVLPTFTAAPADNATTGGTIAFASSTPVDTGGSGIDRVAVERATHLGSTWTEVSSDSTNPYTSLDWASAVTGHFDFRLVAYDRAGNSAATAVLVSNVLVDNTPPTAPVEIKGPAGGASVGGTVTVQATTTDADSGVARVAFLVDGVQVTGASDVRAAFSWNTTGAIDGAHTLVLRGFDNVGNTADTTIGSVTVDNTGPNAPAFVSPPANGSVHRGTVSLSSTTPSDATTSIAHIDLEESANGGSTWTLVSSVTTPGPYSYSWNTAAGVDGTFSLRLRAYDVVGNASSPSTLVTGLVIDNTSPALPAPTTAPATGSAQPSLTVTVAGSVSDALSGVASVALQARVGAAAYATVATDSTGAATYTTTWTAPSDRLVDLRVVATDVAGNTRTTAVATSVTLDTTLPTAVTWMQGPAPSAIVHAPAIAIQGSASDLNLARVAFLVDTIQVTADVRSVTTWSSLTVADGAHTLALRAWDTAGNETTSSRAITVDNTAPSAPIVTSPTASTFVTGSVSVIASATDATSGLARIALYVDGSATATTSAIGAGYSWASTGVADGAHALTLRAFDNGGLSTDTVVPVTVDNTAPAVATLLQGPAAGAQVRQSVTVRASTSDGGSGVARIALRVDGTQVAADVTAATAWDTTLLADGSHTLVLRSYDNVGLTSDLTISLVTVDNTAPSAPVFFTGPAAASAVNGTVQIMGTSTDTNLSRVAFVVMGIPRIADVHVTAQPWTTTVESEGANTISLVAYDLAGNSSTTSRSVTVDNVAPSLSVSAAPASGSAQAASTVTVTGSAGDVSGSGLASVVLQARIAPAAYATVATDLSGLPSYSLTTSALADGVWDLRVVATDIATNATTVTAATGVVVDTTPPTLPVFAQAPAASAAIRGTVQIQGTSFDTNLVRVAFLVDGSQVAADVRSATGWNTASGSFADGNHTIALQAYDVAGNTSTIASRTVTVDNTAPTVPVLATTPTITPGVRYGDTIVVNATSSDLTTSVTRIELLDGSTVLTADIGAGYSWDTRLGPDGTHTLTARAYDLAGNTADTALAVIVDNLPPAAPTGVAVAPLTNTNPAVTWDALVGTNDVSEWHVYVDGSLAFATAPATSYTPNLALDGTADGPHTFVVRAFDGIHESPGSTSVTTTLDTVVPATPTFIAGPADGAAVAGTASLQGLSSDLHLTRVALLVDGLEKAADVRLATPWSTASAGDGSHVIALLAHDGAGNVSALASRTVIVDNTAPAVTVATAPASGSAQATGLVAVTGTATDTGGTGVVSISLEARTGSDPFAQVAPAGPTTPYDLSATLGDGVWDLRVIAVDAVGNATITPATTGVIVDTTSPTAPTFFTAPTNGSNVSGAVAVQGASTDTNLTRIALLVDGHERVSDVISATTWNTASETDGGHVLTLKAYDLVAHSVVSVGSLTVTVDNTGPTTPAITTTPTIQPGHRYGDTIVVHASASDATTAVAAIELREGATVLAADIRSGFAWDTTSGVADGSHTLTARAYDVLGNTTDATITIVVDNTAPAAPAVTGGASPTSAQPTLTWPAPSSGSDVVAWHVYRDGSITAVVVAVPSFTDSLGAATDGDHAYVVRAFDGVHESAASTPVTITYDTTAPAPPAAATGTARPDGSGVAVAWSAVVSDLDHYIVRRAIGATAPATVTDGVAACGGPVSTVTCADTAITEKTTYRYSVFAVDAAGNASVPASTAGVTTPDVTAPAAPASLTARVAGAKVVLGWPASTAPDVVGYRLVVNSAHAPTGASDGTVLATGLARTFTRQQPAGTTAYYAAFAQDAVGNTSGAAVVTVVIGKLGRVSPLAGTEARGPVRVSWTPVRKASYYNVQVYLGTRLITQAWPTTSRLSIPTRSLKAGKRYTWYVWPGVGPRRPARYGKLIGSSTFVWLGR